MSQPDHTAGPTNPNPSDDEADQLPDDSQDSVSALTTLYSAERTDVQNSFGHSLTMVTLLVGFSAVVGALVTKYEGDGLRLVIPLFPIPVWGAVAFHALINALVFTHNQSLGVLEERLLNHVRLGSTDAESKDRRRWVGASGGRLVTDAPLLAKSKTRWPYLAMTVMAYGSIGVTVIAFTTACIWNPIANDVSLFYTVPMAVLYICFLGFSVWAWVTTLGIDEDDLNNWAKESNIT